MPKHIVHTTSTDVKIDELGDLLIVFGSTAEEHTVRIPYCQLKKIKSILVKVEEDPWPTQITKAIASGTREAIQRANNAQTLQ